MLRIAETKLGKIQGLACGDPRITIFKGVPYAKPPVGELRWRSPQPLTEKWDGVLNADRFMPMAYQGPQGVDLNEFYTKEINPTASEYTCSEDCLYLNIWTPAKTAEERLPVYLWIHGGGLQAGYPYEMEFDGERVCREDVVFITVGYRLNIFGWMAHPELTAENPGGPRGNYCMEDLIFALKWIRDNIDAFGGDPNCVTIGGQSGGANAVIALMSSPLAEGLFHRAIAQSGAGLRRFGYGTSCDTIETAEETGKEILKLLGVNTIAEARALPAAVIYKAYQELDPKFKHWNPRVDGVLLPEDTLDCMIHDRHHRVPFLLGNNVGEIPGTPASAPLPTSLEGFRAMLLPFLGDETDAFMERFGIRTFEDALAACKTDLLNARTIAARAYFMTDTVNRASDYCYSFDHEIPGEDHPGAYHGSEMWFTFNSLNRCWRTWSGKHYQLAQQVVRYWTNFCKTGDPNGTLQDGTSLPEWKPCTKADPCVMVFKDAPVSAKNELSEAARARIECQLRKYFEGEKQ